MIFYFKKAYPREKTHCMTIQLFTSTEEIRADVMTQWIKMLATQTRGPNFTPPNTHQRLAGIVCIFIPSTSKIRVETKESSGRANPPWCSVAVGRRQPQHHYDEQVCGGQMGEKEKQCGLCGMKRRRTGDSWWQGSAWSERPVLLSEVMVMSSPTLLPRAISGSLVLL